MGDLPNDVRTHFMKLGSMETGVLASLLLKKKASDPSGLEMEPNLL